VRLTTRLLPVAEWAKLAATEFRHLPYVTGDELAVVVVEDGDRIVGCWGLMPMLHLEGLWIDPAYRGRPSVAKRLLAATWAAVKARGVRWVMTAADSDGVRRLLERHLAARKLPTDSYVIAMEGAKRCRWLS
jgi:ribosomal protein S18 acetylase RimI-like enzyme